MNLAFVDNFSVRGGLSRFSLLLCKSMAEHDPSLKVDYFVHYDNLQFTPEIKDIHLNVNVRLLESTRPNGLPGKIADKLLASVGLYDQGRDNVTKEIEKRVDRNYDLAYFPSAHMMKRPALSIPVVGTLHDFNWKYFFGRQIFPLPFVEMMDEEILKWMDNGFNICSSQDVVDEAKKLYPSARNFPRVIHIGPVVVNSDISDERASAILKELKIDFPYIIFPGNFFPHKNHLNLFTAFSLLKQRSGFADYKLILTGLNSEQVRKGIAGTRGVQLITRNSVDTNFDVMGMGYQPNEALDALISKAKILVSPSIYEAICTPAMDAWSFGTPTAISDIPPFREHEKVLGIKSAFFDPKDPANMADVLEVYLNDYPSALADGKVSRENMAKYKWSEVAEGYLEVFKNAIATL